MPLHNMSAGGGKVEYFEYEPGPQESGDLEPATKTINVTSEQASPDYSATLTIPASPDARIVVLRTTICLNVTIDSWAGAGTTLNYNVKRGGVSIATGGISGTGALQALFDVTTSCTGAQALTVFFWVDADSCVLSAVELKASVGVSQAEESVLRIDNAGVVTLVGAFTSTGEGSSTGQLFLYPGSTVGTGLYLAMRDIAGGYFDATITHNDGCLLNVSPGGGSEQQMLFVISIGLLSV